MSIFSNIESMRFFIINKLDGNIDSEKVNGKINLLYHILANKKNSLIYRILQKLDINWNIGKTDSTNNIETIYKMVNNLSYKNRHAPFVGKNHQIISQVYKSMAKGNLSYLSELSNFLEKDDIKELFDEIYDNKKDISNTLSDIEKILSEKITKKNVDNIEYNKNEKDYIGTNQDDGSIYSLFKMSIEQLVDKNKVKRLMRSICNKIYKDVNEKSYLKILKSGITDDNLTKLREELLVGIEKILLEK